MVWSDKTLLFLDLCKHLSYNQKVASAEVLNSRDSNSKYCKIVLKSGTIYGFSYIPMTDLYELWNKWGQNVPFEEQMHLSFTTVCQFAEWFSKFDVDEYASRYEIARLQALKEVDEQWQGFSGKMEGTIEDVKTEDSDQASN